jgi:phage gp29-like protein
MPPGWSIKLVEATANTAATFERQIALADRGMTIALHGTNLTNEEGGSYANVNDPTNP